MRPHPKPKTIRLKGKAYTEFRKSVHDRAGGECEQCGRHAPLLVDGRFHPIYCGHVSHKKSIGAGGNDILDNVCWHCPKCHGMHHGPRWGFI